MSNFRDKAREIKAEGAARRGNFQPSGAPLNVYNYWLENSRGTGARRIRWGTERENFCHFWRVVMIWSPLLMIRNSLARLSKVWWSLWGATMIGVMVFVIYVLLTTVPLLEMLAIIGVSIVFILAGLATLFLGGWVGSKMSLAARERLGIFISGLLVSMIPGIFIGGAIFNSVLTFAIISVVSFGVLATIYFNADRIGSFIDGRRAVAEAEREKRGGDILAERTAPREPGKISKFFTAVGDFFVMFGQVVRVNKWKICPLVEVDPKR